MKKLLFTAILLSSMSVYSQTAPTVTPEGLNNPTPPPTVVVDPNNNDNSNANEAEVTKVAPSGDIVNGAPDTHVGGTPTVVDPAVVAPSGDVVNGAPAANPVPQGKNPTRQENPADNTGPVEVTPATVE